MSPFVWMTSKSSQTTQVGAGVIGRRLCKVAQESHSLTLAPVFRWVHGHSSGHPDLLGGGGRLLRGGKAQAAEVCHQLLQTSTAGL